MYSFVFSDIYFSAELDCVTQAMLVTSDLEHDVTLMSESTVEDAICYVWPLLWVRQVGRLSSGGWPLSGVWRT